MMNQEDTEFDEVVIAELMGEAYDQIAEALFPVMIEEEEITRPVKLRV